ncbi:hypothetical protein SEVIR_4G194800v4 [Setaria viridis]|uniref:Uncharacterized protein n=1 Tax=Setaria viridis TaxID=4556 RepID=A0A4U6V2I0_SETVI|nr:hypothetical protein SEVIR_4G194800v2 [Setaria viridis]
MPATLFPLQWYPSTRASTILFFLLRTHSSLADASIRLRRHDWWLLAPRPGFISSAGRPLYTSIHGPLLSPSDSLLPDRRKLKTLADWWSPAPRPGFVADAGQPCGPAPPPGASSWNRRIRQPLRRYP